MIDSTLGKELLKGKENIRIELSNGKQVNLSLMEQYAVLKQEEIEKEFAKNENDFVEVEDRYSQMEANLSETIQNIQELELIKSKGLF